MYYWGCEFGLKNIFLRIVNHFQYWKNAGKNSYHT
jgi:hypothetical protein